MTNMQTPHSTLVTSPIDPVTTFVNQRMGQWGEAILHLRARRDEAEAKRRRGSDVSDATDTRVQTMAACESLNGLNRHPDLPCVWVSNSIEYLSTKGVWAYLLQKPNPWGNDNRALYKLYANASNGECPIQAKTTSKRFSFGCSFAKN